MKIADATDKLTTAELISHGTTVLFIPIGKTGDNTAMATAISELLALVATPSSIVDGNATVSIVGGVSGYSEIIINAVSLVKWKPSGLVPTTTGSVDLGTSALKLNDIHMSGAINLGSDAAGDIYYRDASSKFVRLPKATDGQVLTLTAGLPSWQNTTITNEYYNILTADSAIVVSNTYIDITGLSYVIASTGTYEYEFTVINDRINSDGADITNKYRLLFSGSVATASDMIAYSHACDFDANSTLFVNHGQGLSIEFLTDKGVYSLTRHVVVIKGTVKVSTIGTIKLQHCMTATVTTIGDGLLAKTGSNIRVKKIA
jgi:hypothetical protein